MIPVLEALALMFVVLVLIFCKIVSYLFVLSSLHILQVNREEQERFHAPVLKKVIRAA